MSVLILNFSLYILALLYIYRKERSFSVKCLVFAFYAIFSFFGILTVSNGVYFYTFGNQSLTSLNLTPYILNYLLVLLLAQSLNGIKSIRYNLVNLSSKWVGYFEIFILICAILQIFMQYIWYSTFGGSELAEIYNASHTGEQSLTFSNGLYNILYFRTKEFLNIAIPFAYAIEFMKLALHKNTTRALLLIILLFAVRVIGDGIMANRGGVVFSFTSVMFFLIIFWRYFKSSTKNTIKIFGAFSLFVAVSMLIAVTISRFGSSDSEMNSGWMRYLGEPFPNLGWRIWNVDGNFIWGRRTFPSLFEFFSNQKLPTFKGASHMYYYYYRFSNWPVLNFKTLYGDMYIEFGPFLPFLIVLIYNYIVKKMQDSLKNGVFSLLIIHFSYMLLVFGLFNSNITQSSMVSLLITYIACYCLTKGLKSRVKKEKIITDAARKAPVV